MKHCKVYLLFLTSCLLLPSPVMAGGGEAPSPFYIDRSFNILPPMLTSRRAYKRSSYNTGSYYSEDYNEATARENFNVKAWAQFLKRSEKDSKAIVYEGTVPDDLEPETKAYLAAVRAQEPLVWPPHKEPQPYDLTIEKLQTALAETKSDFLRQRYAFLIIRLAHYSKQYDRVETLYSQYQKERQQPESEIGHWIDALYAGALQRKGKRAEAAYQFAKVFQHSKTRRLEAQLNFVIKTDDEWNALLALCKDDNEKALMYFVRSLKSKANSLQELRTIYALAPDSQWVDEALVRELEYVQFAKGFKPMPSGGWWQELSVVNHDQLIADSNGDPKLFEQTKQRRIAYLAEFKEMVATIRGDKKRKDLFLSDFAGLYLKLLQQQPVSVKEVQDFQATYADKDRISATKPLEYFVYLESLEAIDAPAEKQISAYLEQLIPQYRVGEEYGDNRGDFAHNIMDYTYIKLEPLYLKQKADWQPAKTYSAKNRGEVLLDNMQVVELRDFKRLIKEDKSQHSLLLQNMLKDMRESNNEASLDKAIARKYLAADMPEEALTALKNVPDEQANGQQISIYNPFNTSVAGHNRKPGTNKTLKQVVETLLALKKQVKENPKDTQAYYLLGTLHYNMSWFGNSPMLLRYYRSTSNWKSGQIDMHRAKEYYQLALKHSDDRNMTAKIMYALAKIEQVELYTNKANQGANSPVRSSYKETVLEEKSRGLGEYLGKLASYSDTDYHRDVISQCADYQYFHSK